MNILILSLESSAAGLNLQFARHVVLLHPMLAITPQFAATYEKQAIGRLQRMGQTREVHVWRLEAADTIEPELTSKNISAA